MSALTSGFDPVMKYMREAIDCAVRSVASKRDWPHIRASWSEYRDVATMTDLFGPSAYVFVSDLRTARCGTAPISVPRALWDGREGDLLEGVVQAARIATREAGMGRPDFRIRKDARWGSRSER